MQQKLLSIIIPVYNADKYLKACINSILKQSYSFFELILVDDGSTDLSGKMCDEYAAIDTRIKAYHINNSGPSTARNYGIKVMSGEYLAFVDADDVVEPFMYEKAINQLEKDNTDIAICCWMIHDEGENTVEKADIGQPGIYEGTFIKSQIIFEDILYGGGFPWNRVVRYQRIKERCKKDVLFPENIHIYEDCCWNILMLQYVHKVSIMSFCGYHYYIRSSSLSRNKSLNKRQDIFLAWDEIASILEFFCEFNGEVRKKFFDIYTWGIRRSIKDDKYFAKSQWDHYKKRYGLDMSSLKKVLKTIFFEIYFKFI